MKRPVLIGSILILLLAGTASGYGLSKLFPRVTESSADSLGAPGTLDAGQIQVGQVYGANDDDKFPDVSEGIVEKGGVAGEGTHHLIRPGGKSQTVYLTSSVVDLDLFNGHKVQIKGQTFSAQQASWFMDVGSVKVIELNAQKPAGSE